MVPSSLFEQVEEVGTLLLDYGSISINDDIRPDSLPAFAQAFSPFLARYIKEISLDRWNLAFRYAAAAAVPANAAVVVAVSPSASATELNARLAGSHLMP